jgi:hypothetical protein
MGYAENYARRMKLPVIINGQIYYRTAEACRMARISKNTFLRWVREGILADVELRDRRGWRLFSNDDLAKLKAEVHKVHKNHMAQKPDNTSLSLKEATISCMLEPKTNFSLPPAHLPLALS